GGAGLAVRALLGRRDAREARGLAQGAPREGRRPPSEGQGRGQAREGRGLSEEGRSLGRRQGGSSGVLRGKLPPRGLTLNGARIGPAELQRSRRLKGLCRRTR